MSLPNLFELQEHLSRENLLICFSGPFRHSIIEELGSAGVFRGGRPGA